MKFKKEKVKSSITTVIIIIGVIVCFYPLVSNYIAKINHTEVIKEYTNAVEELDEEVVEEELAKATKYNENVSGDLVHDPFIAGSGYALPDDYLNVLNINGDGVMAYIEIPQINCYLPIYHGTDTETLAKGVGHIKQSSLPIGGTSTHAVLTGHTGLPTSELFTKLDRLEEGDVFYIHILNQTLKYEIYETEVIDPEDISKLTIEEGKDLVTLVTCTPYSVNTHRLLIKGERTEEEEEEIIVAEEENTDDDEINLLYIFIAIEIFVIVIILIILFLRVRKDKTYKKRSS